VQVVEKLQSAGLFATWRHSPEELAKALQLMWELGTGRLLPGDTDELLTSLIIMDRERTWVRDIDVCNLGVSDQLYVDTFFEIEGIGGRGFGGFSDPGEDWGSVPGVVSVDVRWKRKLRQFAIPRTNDGILHPRMFEELNSLLPEDGARLYFIDIGPTVAVVIRLTSAEQRKLAEVTGIEVLDRPPDWWTQAARSGLASLDANRVDPLQAGLPAYTPPILDSSHSSPLDNEELRGVSITDYEVDGHLVFSVWVSAADYIRGGDVEAALEQRVTAALGATKGVSKAVRADREQWEVTGDPDEAELEQAVADAVESVLLDYSEDIADV